MHELPPRNAPHDLSGPSAEAADRDASSLRHCGIPLHTRIFLGLLVGAAAGIAVNALYGPGHEAVDWVVSNITEPIGLLFLRLLSMIVIPLVVSSLILGVAGIGDVRTLGRIGLKSFVYTVAFSAISVAIGVTLANTIQPGRALSPQVRDELEVRGDKRASEEVKQADQAKPAVAGSPLMQAVKTLVPANPVAAAAGETPNMMQLMVYALLVGITVTLLPRATTSGLLETLQGLYEVSVRLVGLLMHLAPAAVACLLFNNTARFGLDLLQSLLWFMTTVLIGLGLQMFVVYPLSIRLLSGLSPFEFFRRIEAVILTAFSTSSSNATLPTALRVAEEDLGIPREINGFVLTVGATANQNGTALYEGVAVLFLAQIAGVDLSLGQQLMLVCLAILGGIGTAGVPSGSIPFIIGVLATLGINPSLVGIIIGVDRILDMCRTTLNVVGDLTIATYVARSEGHGLLATPPSPQTSRDHAEPSSPPAADDDSERPWLDDKSLGGQ